MTALLYVVVVAHAAGDTARGLLLQQIDDAVDKLKHLRVKDALHTVDKDMTQRITVPMIELLQTFPPGLWPRLHAVRDRAVSNAAKSLFDELKGVELTQQEGQALQDKLESNSSRKMQAHLQVQAGGGLWLDWFAKVASGPFSTLLQHSVLLCYCTRHMPPVSCLICRTTTC